MISNPANRPRPAGAVALAELYASIQGEGTRVGRPCVFVRLAGCNLECVYCDSEHAARGEGILTGVGDIVSRVRGYGVRLVQVTGGEPLIQPAAGELVTSLLDAGLEVVVETNGTVDIGLFDRRASCVVDIKTPGSGAGGSFLEANFDRLRPDDEVKFVVVSREDFDWAMSVVRERRLHERLTVLFSAAWGMVGLKELASWIIGSGLDIRLNPQLHKHIWSPDARGV
ncbi:MAG: 7-carboxy-7-deazaguanine synthase QueE [Candidatus Nitrospinota bacterium M3_3B_026]